MSMNDIPREREHDDIPCQIGCRIKRQVQIPALADDIQRDSPLDRFVDTRINVPERRALYGQSLFDSPVVDGPQTTHIIGRGIGTHPRRFQEVFIAYHQIGINFIEKHVIFATKTLETPDDSRVPFSGTRFPNLSHLPDNLAG